MKHGRHLKPTVVRRNRAGHSIADLGVAREQGLAVSKGFSTLHPR